MIDDLLSITLALVSGIGLGAIFFGGLWLTLLKLSTTRWPLLLALGSLVGRMGITLGGFYLIMGESWQRLLACVLGFILARHLLIRYLQPTQSAPASAEQE